MVKRTHGQRRRYEVSKFRRTPFEGVESAYPAGPLAPHAGSTLAFDWSRFTSIDRDGPQESGAATSWCQRETDPRSTSTVRSFEDSKQTFRSSRAACAARAALSRGRARNESEIQRPANCRVSRPRRALEGRPTGRRPAAQTSTTTTRFLRAFDVSRGLVLLDSDVAATEAMAPDRVRDYFNKIPSNLRSFDSSTSVVASCFSTARLPRPRASPRTARDYYNKIPSSLRRTVVTSCASTGGGRDRRYRPARRARSIASAR
jgi:hypothetical protein